MIVTSVISNNDGRLQSGISCFPIVGAHKCDVLIDVLNLWAANANTTGFHNGRQRG